MLCLPGLLPIDEQLLDTALLHVLVGDTHTEAQLGDKRSVRDAKQCWFQEV